jgi:PhnB protein
MAARKKSKAKKTARRSRRKPKPIPDRYPGATPYLCVDRAADAIRFYEKAFGAVELFRIGMPGGGIGHAEIRIGKALIMLSDEAPEIDVRSPRSIGGTPVSVSLYFRDVDAITARAVAAGARLLRPLENQFYGDRNAVLEDPFGHRWSIATRIEDISPRQMIARAAKLYGA